MNLRCKVCGEKAAGFHFGAFTCEGCKSFFGRCCNNMSVIGECRNNKECVIDKKNRTSCKACRLQKCLLVGMSKSGSRYGRRSNWFKQYFQETERNVCKRSIISESDDCERLSKDCERSAPAYTLHGRKEGSIDLATPPPFSSHLYLNCFPQLNLNRFIAYKGDSKFLLTGAAAAAARFTQFNNDANVNVYFDKILTSRCHNETVSNVDDVVEDPLDLSRKASSAEAKRESGSRKAIPLDLSVK